LRLPTEAEWEYAARAGSSATFSSARADAPGLGAVAWFDANSGAASKAVKLRFPNPIGLYDLHGNVWEWCQDRYAPYATVPVSDPIGRDGETFVARGGSWGDPATSLRVANRASLKRDLRSAYVGLRLVCDLSWTPPAPVPAALVVDQIAAPMAVPEPAAPTPAPSPAGAGEGSKGAPVQEPGLSASDQGSPKQPAKAEPTVPTEVVSPGASREIPTPAAPAAPARSAGQTSLAAPTASAIPSAAPVSGVADLPSATPVSATPQASSDPAGSAPAPPAAPQPETP
jgi:hypothetical protein